MREYSAFDIIGPKMVGPSSSHTAGAANIGYVMYSILGRDIINVEFILYGSFKDTYKGHGTDKALLAGILGLKPDDEDLKKSFQKAAEKNLKYVFIKDDTKPDHPNTVKIKATTKSGKTQEIVGSSIGGGSILIEEVNGLKVNFTGNFNTLIVKQKDRFGVLADITRVLAENKINIAFMKVFRHKRGDDAYTIIEVDDEVQREVVDQIKRANTEILEIYIMDKL